MLLRLCFEYDSDSGSVASENQPFLENKKKNKNKNYKKQIMVELKKKNSSTAFSFWHFLIFHNIVLHSDKIMQSNLDKLSLQLLLKYFDCLQWPCNGQRKILTWGTLGADHLDCDGQDVFW